MFSQTEKNIKLITKRNDLGDFPKKKFIELEISHNSNILIFTKDKNLASLAKKLKPEFSRVFLCYEYKELVKTLSSINNDSIDFIPIDLILIDFDYQSTFKVIELVHKRPMEEATSNCPLIPMVVLLNEKIDDESFSMLNSLNINKIIHPGFKSSDVLFCLTEVLYIFRKVDSNFKDIRNKKIISSKYPYLPIFDKPKRKSSSAIETLKPEELESIISGDSSTFGFEKLEEIDDITENSSLYPNIIKDARKQHPELNNRYNILSLKSSVGKTEKKSQEASILVVEHSQSQLSNTHNSIIYENQQLVSSSGVGKNVENNIPQFQKTFSNIEKSVDETKGLDIPKIHSEGVLKNQSSFDEKGPLSLQSNIEFTCNQDDSKHEQSDDTIVDQINYNKTEDITEITSKLSDEQQNSLTRKSSTGLNKPILFDNNDFSTILNSSCRPVWRNSKYRRKSTKSDEKKKGPKSFTSFELDPFIDKIEPKPDDNLTVGGLDKQLTRYYWGIVKNKANLRRSFSMKISNTKTHDAIKEEEDILYQDIVANDIQKHTKKNTSPLNFANPKDDFITIVLKAEKKLGELAKEACPDGRFRHLIDLDFSNRKINLGEREMMERGLQLEKEGDLELANICYTRAGAHSKDPQISKMMLGNLNFRSGKLMTALKFYNLAIKILSEKIVKVTHDEFLAYRNRAVINFRLGDDEIGLSDLEKAVQLVPSNTDTRDLLNLVKRRLGSYKDAIEQAIVVKAQRNEKRRNDFLQLYNKKKDKKKALVYEINKQESFSSLIPLFKSDKIVSREDPRNENNSIASNQSSEESSHMSHSHYAKSTNNQLFRSNSIIQNNMGVTVKIAEPQTFNSLKDKINSAIKLSNTEISDLSDEANEKSGGGGGYLKLFKMNYGFKENLFEDIFIKPNDLQQALLIEPKKRLQSHLDSIFSCLRSFPFLYGLSESSLYGLANVIEYRAMTQKGKMFIQNNPSYGVIFLLNGNVNVKMESSSMQTMVDVNLMNLGPFNSFGQIDILFRNYSQNVTYELESFLEGFFFSKNSSSYQQDKRKKSTLETIQLHDEKEGSILTPNENHGKKHEKLQFSHRSLAPGMFKSYELVSMSEFLIVDQFEFEKLLLKSSLNELERRLEVLKCSGVFRDWSEYDMIRLARMGFIKKFEREEIILKQGEKPDYLYIIMKGMCKVLKEPNRTEMLYQKLNAAKEKAEKHDLKYSFHRDLTEVLRKVDLKDQESFIETIKSEKMKTKIKQKVFSHFHLTEAEFERIKIQVEIEKLENLIAQARSQELNDKFNSSASRLPELNLVEGKVSDICIIQWPMIFGEACILEPEEGVSRGTIKADTSCEIYMLHKKQIQTFSIEDSFLEKIKAKSVVYPSDPDIVVSLYRGSKWQQYRQEMMGKIRKDRWPKNLNENEPFSV